MHQTWRNPDQSQRKGTLPLKEKGLKMTVAEVKHYIAIAAYAPPPHTHTVEFRTYSFLLTTFLEQNCIGNTEHSILMVMLFATVNIFLHTCGPKLLL